MHFFPQKPTVYTKKGTGTYLHPISTVPTFFKLTMVATLPEKCFKRNKAYKIQKKHYTPKNTVRTARFRRFGRVPTASYRRSCEIITS
jgi:hypothetical protein